MKLTKNKMIVYVISLFILLGSLTLTLLDALIPLNLWTHPILTFLFCIFLGFGVMSLVLGYCKKCPWRVFVGSVLFSLAILYVLLQYVFVWLAILITFVLIAILSIFSFMRMGSKTEFALNDSEDYKDYKQRKQEKAQLEESQEQQPLPEIKSFK